jgi:large subunit ribosomal protein L6
MSRLGKRVLKLPAGVAFEQQAGKVKITGPQGSLTRAFDERVKINFADGAISLEPRGRSPAVRALWGTTSAHLANMVKGVTEGFTRTLLIEGLGYKAAVAGSELTLHLGFSHPVTLKIPEGLAVTADKGTLTVKGIDPEELGQFAARVRDLRRVEPYKGKGVRYETEVVRRKVGKRVTA